MENNQTVIQHWLELQLKNMRTVEIAYLFGSFVSCLNYRDVDVLLIFNQYDVREQLRSLKRNFSQKFGVILHPQLFHLSDLDEYKLFLTRNADAKRIK